MIPKFLGSGVPLGSCPQNVFRLFPAIVTKFGGHLDFIVSDLRLERKGQREKRELERRQRGKARVGKKSTP